MENRDHDGDSSKTSFEESTHLLIHSNGLVRVGVERAQVGNVLGGTFGLFNLRLLTMMRLRSKLTLGAGDLAKIGR